MHEMEGDVMSIEREARTPRVDRLQDSTKPRGEGMSMAAENARAQATRSDEIGRGKQPVNPSR